MLRQIAERRAEMAAFCAQQANGPASEYPYDNPIVSDDESAFDDASIRGIVDSAIDGDDDCHDTQSVLQQDAAGEESIIAPHEIGHLINYHRDADVRVFAIRHPNADAEHLASVAASVSEPRAIVEEARAKLSWITGRH